jgi:hypothetical protein
MARRMPCLIASWKLHYEGESAFSYLLQSIARQKGLLHINSDCPPSFLSLVGARISQFTPEASLFLVSFRDAEVENVVNWREREKSTFKMKMVF